MARFDVNGLLVEAKAPGVLNVTATYDSRGRPLQVTQGLRSTTVAWGGGAFPLSVTDALARATGFQYDAVGRATKVTLPEGEALQLGYDGVGNIVRLTPPNTLPSDFGYTTISQLASYQPPALPGIGSYGYAYDLDGALKIATHPDATTSQYQRDTAGRLTKLKAPWGDYDFGYEPGTGQMKSAAHGGQSIQWSYDGFLLTAETATGPVKGTVGYSFDDDFRVASLAVNGAAVAYAFDGDGLLTAAGSLVLARSPATGQLLSGTQGVVASTWAYDGYGALETATAKVSGATIFQEVIVRDALARPASKTEVVQGVTVNWTYRYDAANRLQQVTKDGATVGTYLFDANGNRTSTNGVAATFDAQDRLLNAGAVQYRYDAFGSVIDRRDTATTPAPLTQYQYDGNGGLRKATLPDGTVLDYVVDARARRVGKKRNGMLERGWLYDGQLRIVAELDGSGAVFSRYVYGVLGHSPDYLERGGVTYRFVHDSLGSVRLVINSATGAVAQRLDYDAWGVVLADSASGFQPFGFVGGLYDGTWVWCGLGLAITTRPLGVGSSLSRCFRNPHGCARRRRVATPCRPTRTPGTTRLRLLTSTATARSPSPTPSA